MARKGRALKGKQRKRQPNRRVRTRGALRLARWMKARGYSQAVTADLFGVHFSLVSMLVSGTRVPSARKAIKIQRLTGIPVIDWFTPVGGRSNAVTVGRGGGR